MDERQMAENFRDLEDVVTAAIDNEAERAAAIARAHVRRFNSYMELQQQRKKT
jgi:hypothetical protein